MHICYCGHKKEYHKSKTKHKVCIYSECECIDFKKAPIPLYVKLGEETILRLREKESMFVWSSDEIYGICYYKDAGEWGIRFKLENDKLYAHEPDKNSLMHHVHGMELVASTKKAWEKDNEGHTKWLKYK